MHLARKNARGEWHRRSDIPMELYSPEGLRLDGRRWNELRRFECHINTHPNLADGSSYVEQGNTKVVCLVQGPMEPKQQLQLNECTIEVNVNVTNFSTFERRKRGKSDRQVQELVTTLERTFDQSIMTHLYPRTLIKLDLTVLAQDGGLLGTLVNAMTLALIDAGIAMYDYISAVSAGLQDTNVLLDLNNLEEKDMSGLTVGVIGTSEKLALLMLENKMPVDRLESVLALAIVGSHRIRELMDQEVRRHGNDRLRKRNEM